MVRTAFLTLAFATLLGSSALAQGVIVDEDAGVAVVPPPAGPPVALEDEDGPVIVEEYAGPPPVRYEPPVYGWVAVRPDNCGTFRYWNGERCADARYNPPED